jgi:hypothetical protein
LSVRLVCHPTKVLVEVGDILQDRRKVQRLRGELALSLM